MGFFGKGAKSQIGDWLATVTMEELEAMEKQGVDVTEWKAAVAARDGAGAEAEAARFGGEEVDPSTVANPVNLDKLNPYKATPRNKDGDFVKGVAGKLPLVGKDKVLQKAASNPLIFASVVQANSDLWAPGNNTYLPAVLVFALDEAHRHDIAWLKETAKKIADLKQSSDVPQDSRAMVAQLRDDQSLFCCKLGGSVAGGADAWCATYSFAEQSALPGRCLPSEGIIPFVLKDGPEENHGVWFFDIPAGYYTD
jgi:hypothetical protein